MPWPAKPARPTLSEQLRGCHGHSSEKFWDQFYFDYGHASIADLGHVIVCFETSPNSPRFDSKTSPCGMARRNRVGIRTLRPAVVRAGFRFEDRRRKAPTTAFSAASPRSIDSQSTSDPIISEREPRPEVDETGRVPNERCRAHIRCDAVSPPPRGQDERWASRQHQTLESNHQTVVGHNYQNCARSGRTQGCLQTVTVELWGELCGQPAGAYEPLARRSLAMPSRTITRLGLPGPCQIRGRSLRGPD